MASLVKKKKGNRLYYYVVESARVDGKPRIVHQAYLGTAEKLAELVSKTLPRSLSALCITSVFPAPCGWLQNRPALWRCWNRCGPSTFRTRSSSLSAAGGHHRICEPGPKTEVSNWYERTISLQSGVFLLSALLRKPSGTLEQILPESSETLAPEEDPLDQAQLRLLGCGRKRIWLVVGCWPTIRPTSTPTCQHNTRNNWRSADTTSKVGTTASSGTELCSGRREWVEPMPPRVRGQRSGCGRVLGRFGTYGALLDQNQIARDTVTLVSKGHGALDNTVQLQEAGVGWIAALPWNQAPAGLRERARKSCRCAAPNNRVCGPWARSCWCTARNISRC